MSWKIVDGALYLFSIYIVVVSLVGLFKNISAKYFIPLRILSGISLIFVCVFLIVRLTRRTDTIQQFFTNKPKELIFIFISFIISFMLAIIITVLISLKNNDKDNKDKKNNQNNDQNNKDDNHNDNKNTKLNTPDQYWITIGALCFVALVGVIFLTYKYWGPLGPLGPLGNVIKFLLIISMIGLIFIPALGYWFWMTTQPITPSSSDVFDITYTQPILRSFHLAELKKLLKNLGNFKMDNECKMNDQKDCNYLYNQYIASNGDEKILTDLLDQLQMQKIKGKDGKDVQIGLINQAIYIIYQLIQCNIALDHKTSVYRFGTWEWMSQNILMNSPTDDPIQRFIWGISLIVCILFFLYNIGLYLYNIKDIFGESVYWVLSGAILIFVQFASIWGLIIGTLTSSEGNKVDKPVSKDYQKYEKAYPNKVDSHTKKDPDTKKDPTNSYDTSPILGKERTGLIGLFTHIGLIITAIVMSYVGGDSWWGKSNKIFAISGIIAMVLAFNSYYMIIVPQLVIVGIILQKYILSTDLFDNIGYTIIKGIILIVVLFASFYDTTYNTKATEDEIKQNPEKYKDDDEHTMHKIDTVTGVSGEYNKPIWYIFGILLFILMQNCLESFIGTTDQYDEKQWSLILMPATRYILEIITKGSVPYGLVSVVNQ